MYVLSTKPHDTLAYTAGKKQNDLVSTVSRRNMSLRFATETVSTYWNAFVCSAVVGRVRQCKISAKYACSVTTDLRKKEADRAITDVTKSLLTCATVWYCLHAWHLLGITCNRCTWPSFCVGRGAIKLRWESAEQSASCRVSYFLQCFRHLFGWTIFMLCSFST